MTSLVIVDDHTAVRTGLAALVATEPELEVLAVAADAETAVALCEEHAPDLLVIDVNLPGEDGLSLCLRLNATDARPGLVLYSAFADDLLAVLAIIAGADALVPKAAEPELLRDTLLMVAAGRRQMPHPTPAALTTVGAALEQDDLPILGMLVHGTAAGELAATLAISPEWLLARRWAMLRRLTRRRSRRGTPAPGAPVLDPAGAAPGPEAGPAR